MGKSILVIDDEAMILDAIGTILRAMGVEVHTTTDPVAGTQDAIDHDYDLVLTDIRMPVMNGAEIVQAVRAKKPGARLLLITGYPNDPLVEHAFAAGAIGILVKPFEVAKILEWLNKG